MAGAGTSPAEGRLKVRIVLVRPRNPLNIGAAARAMANFGFEELVAVEPYEEAWRQTVSAVGAEDVVLKARAVKKLGEAIGDCQLVLGTTTVRGRQLGRPVVRLPDLSAFLKKRAGGKGLKVALLFGSEKTGLTEQSLEHCNACVTIPTDPATPSMNLSHAVAVCCYELGARPPAFPFKAGTPVSVEKRERLVKHALELFDAAGYLSLEPPARRLQMVRQSFLLKDLRAADVRLLHGVIRYMIEKMKPR
jgi:tRNA/rRNA methyltransferase